jgi:hypothetical protein
LLPPRSEKLKKAAFYWTSIGRRKGDQQGRLGT